MQWEIILTHRAGHQMSFIRWHEKRPNAEQAYDLVAEHFDVDLDDAPIQRRAEPLAPAVQPFDTEEPLPHQPLNPPEKR